MQRRCAQQVRRKFELREHARRSQMRVQTWFSIDQRRMPFEMRRLLPTQREALSTRTAGTYRRYVLEMQMRGEFYGFKFIG